MQSFARFMRPASIASRFARDVTGLSARPRPIFSAWNAARSFSAGINSNLTNITPTSTPRAIPAFDNSLLFGHNFSDHMLTIEWDVDNGWHAPEIKPFGDLSLHPAASTLHYALECFEGMKAYKDANGTPRLFRPDRNMTRMHDSCTRLALPSFDEEELLECIKKLVVQDEKWIPSEDGFSLYIRPTMIATEPTLGVGMPRKAMFFCIMSPVGPYYSEGFKPVRLYAQDRYARACPGGMGSYKAGGNYAATIVPASEAAKLGCTQILWLSGEDHVVTEVGTMNMFFYWKTPSGETELVTSSLEDEMTLPGVTRKSILELANEWGIKTSERRYTMADVTAAIEEGRIIEAFGSGTAAVVSPVDGILYNDKNYSIPIEEELGAGKLTRRLWDSILDIQYGRTESPWSVPLA